MDFLSLLAALNRLFAVPSTIIFVLVGLILTVKLKFLQFRALPKFFKLIAHKPQGKFEANPTSLPSLKALFTAMATTIGMGNVVGPSVAIMMGGPGALFWLLFFPVFGGLIKFVEVSFALATRVVMQNGRIVGGPAEYLSVLSPSLGYWYGMVTIFLFTTWSALQSNTLGQILAMEGISPIFTGIGLSCLLALVVFGGVRRIGNVASLLVPVMFVLYVSFAFFILMQHAASLPGIIYMILADAFSLKASIGGVAGLSLLQAMRSGVYKSIFITEAGLGTSSIAHALAQVEKPTDQGVLAMYSIAVDTFLAMLSGFMVLLTNVWQCEQLDSTVVYQAFKMLSPLAGRYILLFGIGLFVITTVIGNTLNGSQSFAAISKGRFVRHYLIAAVLCVMLGALSSVPLLWEFSDVMLTLVAIPNVLGLLVLAYKKPEILEVK